jgi:hypothetical protein
MLRRYRKPIRARDWHARIDEEVTEHILDLILHSFLAQAAVISVVNGRAYPIQMRRVGPSSTME